MNDHAMAAQVLAVMVRRQARQQRRVTEADRAHREAIDDAARALGALEQSRQHETRQQAVLLKDVMACVGPASRLTTYQKGLTMLAKAVVERSTEHEVASQTELDRQADLISARNDLKQTTVRLEKWQLVKAALAAESSAHPFEG